MKLLDRLIDRRDRLTIAIDTLRSELAPERAKTAKSKAEAALARFRQLNGAEPPQRIGRPPGSPGRRMSATAKRRISKQIKKRWKKWRAEGRTATTQKTTS